MSQQWWQQLFLLLCCRKNGTSPAGPQVYIKKPPNAFMLFLKEQRPLVQPELKTTGSKAVLTYLGAMVSVYLKSYFYRLIIRVKLGIWERHMFESFLEKHHVWGLLSIHSGSLCQTTKNINTTRRQRSKNFSTKSRTQAGPLKTTM